MVSPTQQTWVWANSGQWWRTGKPWRIAVHGVAESWTCLSDWTTTVISSFLWESKMGHSLFSFLWSTQRWHRSQGGNPMIPLWAPEDRFCPCSGLPRLKFWKPASYWGGTSLNPATGKREDDNVHHQGITSTDEGLILRDTRGEFWLQLSLSRWDSGLNTKLLTESERANSSCCLSDFE